MAKVTNINEGGTVGVKAGSDKQDNNEDTTTTEVTNVNNGGTVGIQAGTVSGSTVIVGW